MSEPKPQQDGPEPILRFFKVGHLPEKLARVSRPFCDLALDLVQTLPRSAERTVALRKLLESKDAAVRAALEPEPAELLASGKGPREYQGDATDRT